MVEGLELLEQARLATSRGEWDRAYEVYLQADAAAQLQAEDLPVLARVAYATGHLDVTITTWERLYRVGREQDDRLTSALAAVQTAMHLLFDTALMAPVRAWLRRAEDSLEDGVETPVHAWVAVVRNYERLLSGDLASARLWAQKAVAIGDRLEPSAAAIGRVAEARALILDGEVEYGLRLLEEAGVSLMTGEIDPLAQGVVYCEVVCGLQGLALFDLAEQWTEVMERWHHSQSVGSVHGRCRVHRAEILRLRGQYAAAEQEAVLACEELRPYLRRELGWPLNELGRIRMRRGDLEGAEKAFLEAEALGWDAQPGLALLRLSQGQTQLAALSIRSSLDNPPPIPSKEMPPATELRRAPLLEAQVTIECDLGDLERASAASRELDLIAKKFGSKALLASSAFSGGRLALAQGDAIAACQNLERAAQLWTEAGAPYESASARMWLGLASFAAGQEDLGSQRLQAAASAFSLLGAGLDAERATSLQSKRSATQDLSSPAGSLGLHEAPINAFQHEGDYWLITFEGSSTRIRDMRGMQYLGRLLSQPEREFHVLDLVLVGHDTSTEAAGKRENLRMDVQASALLDEEAKQSYRRRLLEIEEDIEDARAMNDLERATQAQFERDFLVRELARAVGLGGRDRRAGSASERARVSVTRAIRSAIARIRNQHPRLGEHLTRAIRTGTYCAYLPDTRLGGTWQTD
jgi:hypothetical protein